MNTLLLQARTRKHGWFASLGAGLLLWLISAWFIATLLTRQEAAEAVAAAQQTSERRAQTIAKNMDASIGNLFGTAAYIAQLPETVRAAASTSPAPSTWTVEQRKQAWSTAPALAALNQQLLQATQHLGVDIIWVMDAQGDAIAASNTDTAASFVGTRYSDRDYFRNALAAKVGHQYAMGRKTNIPGLYFSASIRSPEGTVLGVVAVKIDLTRLEYWVNQADAFVSDEFDVVILARTPGLEMQTLPQARISGLPADARLARYKRSEFPALSIAPWRDSRYPTAVAFGNTAAVMARQSLPRVGIQLHVLERLPALENCAERQWQHFLHLAALGSLLILIVGGSFIFGLQRRLSERNVAASLSLHQATIESTSDGILVVDLHSRRITTCNQRVADMWRIPHDLLATGDDHRLLAFVREQLRHPPGFLARVEEIYRQPDELSFDVLQFQDGRVFERHSHPQRLNGQVVGRVWNFRDVTLRDRALEKLAQSELELHTIIDSEPECVSLLSADGTVLKINRAGLTMMEADDADMVIGKKVIGLIAPAYQAAFMEMNARVFAGEAGSLEFELIGFKGGHRWLDTHAVPLRDPHGGIIARLGVTRDISERKEATRHLHLLDFALDHVTEAAYLTDARGRFHYVNAEACRALGYSRDQLRTLSVPDIDHDTDSVTWAATWIHLQQRGAMTVESRHRTRDGRIFPVEVGITCFEYEGRPYALGLARDISERRAAETERAQLQQQLQHAQKLEAIGQLTGGIAHDFNNILGAILGFTGLTLDRFRPQLPEKAVGYLNEVQKAGERARDLIQKMLAFARGSGSEIQVLDPRPLVREVIKMLASTLPSSLELGEQVAATVPAIRIDPVQLHQILTNLVINARDATNGEGHIEVGLRTTRLDGEICDVCHQSIRGEFVELYVKDDGSGIAPEVLPKIFDPFFTTKEVGRGSGMGLAMVMGILREHDGHVLVETRDGHGSTFRLFFHPANGHAPEAAVPVTETATPETGGKHVLVVDDEVSLGALLGEILDANGYRATVYANPRGALEAYRANPVEYDAVITDQTMPGMTGVELVRELLALRPELPVLMVSGYSDKVDAETAEKHGIRRFFYKPVESAALLAALREALP